MTVNKLISKDFATFKIDSELSKDKLWRNLELLTYLTASNEISLEDAEHYTNIIFNMLEQ